MAKKNRLERWANGEESEESVEDKARRLARWGSAEEDEEEEEVEEEEVEEEEDDSDDEFAAELRKARQKAGQRQAPAATPAAAKPRATTTAAAAAAATVAARPAPAADAEDEEDWSEELAELQGDLQLNEIRRSLDEMQQKLSDAGNTLKGARARGYAYGTACEGELEGYLKQLAEIRARVEQQAQALKAEADKVEALLGKRGVGPAVTVLEGKVEAAKESLETVCEQLTEKADGFVARTEQLAWKLEHIEQATFGLLPTEALVDAAPATWKRGTPVKGVLFLTDLRLIFERHEEEAVKKILFITTEVKKHQNLEWEVPLAQVEKAVATTQGLLGMRECLSLTFGPEAPYHTADLDLDWSGDTDVTAAAWAALIGRVKSGEIAKDRATPVAPEAAAAAANVPTKCPSCNAPFTQTVLRGQRELACPFCGTTVRW